MAVAIETKLVNNSRKVIDRSMLKSNEIGITSLNHSQTAKFLSIYEC